MEVIFRLNIEMLPEGVYLGTSEDVPGLVAQGRTIDETVEIAKDVARKLYESYIENGEESPVPNHPGALPEGTVRAINQIHKRGRCEA
jgi:predicted RNase H-like HicB family nuclease